MQCAAFELIPALDMVAQGGEKIRKLPFMQQVNLQFHFAIVNVKISCVHWRLGRINFLRRNGVAEVRHQVLLADFLQTFHPVEAPVAADNSVLNQCAIFIGIDIHVFLVLVCCCQAIACIVEHILCATPFFLRHFRIIAAAVQNNCADE